MSGTDSTAPLIGGPSAYADWERREMAEFLPAGTQRVLDIGCGGGAFGAFLKSQFAGLYVAGVEPDEHAAIRAASRLDAVAIGAFPTVSPGERYDVVYFNDVLEHMVDPAPALTRAKELAPIVVASIPNVRHIDLVRDLVFRGDWQYQEAGVLDRTHVRFYTRKTIVRLFEQHGYRMERIQPINCLSRNRLLTKALRLTRDHQFLPLQFAVVATSKGL